MRIGKECFIYDELFQSVIGLYKHMNGLIRDCFVQDIVPEFSDVGFDGLCQLFVACTYHIRVLYHIPDHFRQGKTFFYLFECHTVVRHKFKEVNKVCLTHSCAFNGCNTVFDQKVIE